MEEKRKCSLCKETDVKTIPLEIAPDNPDDLSVKIRRFWGMQIKYGDAVCFDCAKQTVQAFHEIFSSQKQPTPASPKRNILRELNGKSEEKTGDMEQNQVISTDNEKRTKEDAPNHHSMQKSWSWKRHTKKFSCPHPHCDKSYHIPYCLSRHIMIKHQNKSPKANGKNTISRRNTPSPTPITRECFVDLSSPINCLKCNKQSANVEKYMIHMKRYHNIIHCVPFLCPHCPIQLSNRGNFRRHIEIKHTSSTANANANSDVISTSNPKLPADQKVDVAEPINNHIVFNMKRMKGQKRFRCPNCPKKFAVRGNLKCHIKRRHTSSRAKANADSDSMSTSTPTLSSDQEVDVAVPINNHIDDNKHKRYMRGQGNFRCPHCLKMYSTKGNLKGHINRRHTSSGANANAHSNSMSTSTQAKPDVISSHTNAVNVRNNNPSSTLPSIASEEKLIVQVLGIFSPMRRNSNLTRSSPARVPVLDENTEADVTEPKSNADLNAGEDSRCNGNSSPASIKDSGKSFDNIDVEQTGEVVTQTSQSMLMMSLNESELTVDLSRPIGCLKCDKRLANVSKFIWHMKRYHEKKFPCPHCGRKYNVKVSVARHIRQRHTSFTANAIDTNGDSNSMSTNDHIVQATPYVDSVRKCNNESPPMPPITNEEELSMNAMGIFLNKNSTDPMLSIANGADTMSPLQRNSSLATVPAVDGNMRADVSEQYSSSDFDAETHFECSGISSLSPIMSHRMMYEIIGVEPTGGVATATPQSMMVMSFHESGLASLEGEE